MSVIPTCPAHVTACNGSTVEAMVQVLHVSTDGGIFTSNCRHGRDEATQLNQRETNRGRHTHGVTSVLGGEMR